jgi:hypothetical protein
MLLLHLAHELPTCSNAPAVMDACSFEDVVDYLM